MGQPFPLLFDAHLRDAGLSQGAFARAAGAHQPDISDILNGKRRPPVRHLEAWADVLHLTGSARQEFLRQGLLTHAPVEVAEWVAELLVERDSLRQQIGRSRS